MKAIMLWLAFVAGATTLSQVDGVSGAEGFALACIYGFVAGFVAMAIVAWRNWWPFDFGGGGPK